MEVFFEKNTKIGAKHLTSSELTFPQTVGRSGQEGEGSFPQNY